MESYPLESLLTVRHYREEGAKRRVRMAETTLREAEDAVEKAREELERYRVWRREEEDRRYESIMNVPVSIERLDSFKAGLARLAAGETDRENAVLEAEKHVEACRRELDSARDAASAARKNTSKIQAHKRRPNVRKTWNSKNSVPYPEKAPKRKAKTPEYSRGDCHERYHYPFFPVFSKQRTLFIRRWSRRPCSSRCRCFRAVSEKA